MRIAMPVKKNGSAGYIKAQNRIAQAAAETEKTLDLVGLALTSVPPELGHLTSLTVLKLGDNQLTSLPPEIGQLTALTDLSLNSNQLTSLPPEIGQLTALTDLNLNSNQLTSLPPEIGQLTALLGLSLSCNQLKSLPPEIGQLKALIELGLGNNQLTSLPPEIGKLTALLGLSFSINQLKSLPPEIGQLKALTKLSLSDNQLTSLPLEIGQLTALIELSLGDNKLTRLPKNMQQLSRECILFVHRNPQLGLPYSVLGPTEVDWYAHRVPYFSLPKAGPILDYYFRTRREKDRRPLCEGKLILVGRGDVGKTSLVKRLVENQFSRREDTTQGIRIQKWDLKVGENHEQIRLHVWDFGGQEIMHATHQFFLTDRSLYLLVLDGRADQQDSEADYWLRLIAGFAPESPVLVVLNKIKKNRFDVNQGALKQKFPQIKAFVETDCDNPGADRNPGLNGFGIEQLHHAICQEVNALPEIRQVFPASWFAIKEKLSKMDDNFLTIDEYRNLCRENGETSEESQDHLSLFLHRLGIALNYRDDRRLQDRHVLNPHWLTSGIYRLLNSTAVAERKGELRLHDLGDILPFEQYPAEMHPFLLSLMEKFELCFSFPGDDKYLIPELLDKQQPKAASDFDQSSCLNFRYLYPVLPPGLLPRFIARTHVLSDLSQQHRWRTGVIISFEGNTALVKADPAEKTVQVLINGPATGRPRMLAVIRQDFDTIHRDIPHLTPEELVAFPDHPQVTVPFAELEVLYNASPTMLVVRVANGQVIQHTAASLLEGVEFDFPAAVSRIGRSGGKPDEAISNALVKVFYSYSRVDAKKRQKLGKHLAPLERINLIQTWYDNEIIPGSEFNPEIKARLVESDIILLLISPDFAASDYCNDIELPMVIRRHKATAGNVAVVPVIITETNGWRELTKEGVKLGELGALPLGCKAISKWKPNDVGWADVAAGVQRIAEALRDRRAQADSSRKFRRSAEVGAPRQS
jgi:internalin A